MGQGERRDLILVGAGKMGVALLDGWMSKGVRTGQQIAIVEPNPTPVLHDRIKESEIVLFPDLAAADLSGASAVILAVKPQIMGDVLSRLPAQDAADTVFISIAAGLTIEAMAQHLGSEAAIIRAMPNTPASIGKGITAYYPSETVNAPQKELCQTLLSAVGQAVELDQESLIDLVTAVSGSGPAYVFYLIECLAEAGRDAGLDEALAMQLSIATVEGAGALALSADIAPSELRRNVTSPGGTTEAALKVLRSDDGLQKLVSEAVTAAIARAKELDG